MINRISSSTVITIVIIKVTMKRKENKKQISIKTYLVWTVQHCFCVCMCVIPVLKFKHTSPSFTHKIQFSNRRTNYYSLKDIVALLVSKTTQVTFHVAIMAVFIWNVCSLCKNSGLVQVSSRGMSFTVCICEHLSCSLSTTRLLFGFWMTESKGRITLEYQLF